MVFVLTKDHVNWLENIFCWCEVNNVKLFCHAPDKADSQVPSIKYHSTGTGLCPCVTVHQESTLTDIGGLLKSSIFSVNPLLVDCVAIHALTFAPVSTKTVSRWLFLMTCVLKSFRLFVEVLLTLILRRSILKMSTS